MTTKIDAKMFLADVREKVPSAKNYPDDILLKIIQEHPDTIEGAFPGFTQRLPTFEFATDIPKAEGLLQKAIRAYTPKGGQEWADVGRGIANQTIVPAMQMSPMQSMTEQALKFSGLRSPTETLENFTKPKTEWGNALESNVIKPASLAIPGALGAKQLIHAGGKGIMNLMKKPGMIKEQISDVARFGPQKVKDYISRVHNVFIRGFDKELKNMKGFLHSDVVADALEATAKKLGSVEIEGSQGYRAQQMAKEYRLAQKLYPAEEVQALINSKGVIPKAFGKDMASRVHFHDSMAETLGNNPQMSGLKDLRKDYSQIFDIKAAGKKVNRSRLEEVAGTGRRDIGREGLSELAEAEQTYRLTPKAPNPVEQISSLGETYKKAQLRRNVALGGMGVGGLTSPYGIYQLLRRRD